MIRVFLSAGLLYLSFPNVFSFYGFPALAWVFAVPLFQALENKTLIERIKVSAVFSIIGYGLITNWFIHYNFFGFLFFVVLLGVQPVIFAIFFPQRLRNDLAEAILIACAWTASEYLREFLMRGFSWDVGHSQVFQNVFLQFADLYGSKGISFLIILVNCCLFQAIRQKRQRLWRVVFISGIFLFLTFYGITARGWHQKQMAQKQVLDACLVQPDIDFKQKREWAQVPEILQENLSLTQSCFREGKPDILFWPETAVPADLRQDAALWAELRSFVMRRETPLFFGMALEEEGRLYNSAVLLGADGMIQNIYRKRFLVPFSEYMPWGRAGAFLAEILKINNYHFTAGKETKIISLAGVPAPFGVMICSEDTLASVFQEYSSQGAGGLVILLNDGWFQQRAGLAIHGQQAIMHAVEQRMPVIRISNNGWSASIDVTGRLDSGNLPVDEKGTSRIKMWLYQGRSYPFFRQIFCVFCWGFVIIRYRKRFLHP